eukprot:scaffold127852_cov17-Tisochrysis_lutea.AAC.2
MAVTQRGCWQVNTQFSFAPFASQIPPASEASLYKQNTTAQGGELLHASHRLLSDALLAEPSSKQGKQTPSRPCANASQ